MRIKYLKWNASASSLTIVDKANEIIEEYAEQGYDLTLRMLYYQFVSRDMIPNTQESYGRLGSIITKARDSGMIDWDVIKDRGRSLYGHTHYPDGSTFVRSFANRFHSDLWQDQDRRIQVWVEKEALADVVARAANAWDVDYFACKGYMSASSIWEMGRWMVRMGGDWLVLHLGDHDPSGIDMSRDIEERLRRYTTPLDDEERPNLEVRRIALNMDQVEQYDPPPNPAKVTDSRAEKYIDEYGDSSWELDALEPSVIVDLISEHIEAEISDREAFEAQQEFQSATREKLSKLRVRV